MLSSLSAAPERYSLSAPFRISRGVKTQIEVVVAEVRRGALAGRGEGVPYPRYGEDPAGVVEQIMRSGLDGVPSRRDLLDRMPAGSARNAIDCALWDLESRERGENAAGARPVVTALTISLDEPEAMAEAALKLPHAPLLKVKVDGADPEAQLRAVRAAAPRAKLIVDPNESWSFDLLRDLQPLLRAACVDLLEQPLPAGEDDALEGFTPAVPICADESCHVAADLDRVGSCYQAINIKLDKTGGLTEAISLYGEARRRGLQVMVGCMICTSLSIAPAALLAVRADFVDLDGPLWLQRDRPGGVTLRDGALTTPSREVWAPEAAEAALHNLKL